jgi:hypothetical protein
MKLQTRCLNTFFMNHQHRPSISLVPPEILAQIFVECLPNESESDNCDHSSYIRQDPPLVFTTVCREWRHIALNEPRLWCTLHVYIPGHLFHKGNDFWANKLDGIRKWLQRSGEVPLLLSFIGEVPITVSESREAYYRFVFELELLFVSQSHRWKSLVLDGHFLIEPFLDRPGQNPSILDSVKIAFSKRWNAPVSDSEKRLLKHILSTSPLRRLQLRAHESFDPSWLGSRWSGLTEIALQPVIRGEGPTLTLSMALDILSQAISLQCCVMDLTVVQDAIDRNCHRSPIILPFLHTLNIYLAINLAGVSYAGEDDARNIFSPLITPKLQTLTIKSWVRQSPPSAFTLHFYACYLSLVRLPLRL